MELDIEAGATVTESAEASFVERERELLVANVVRMLPEMIAQVPLRQRQVVIARFYEGRSFEDIAETLSIRPATARSLLRHGLNRMRQNLTTLTNKKD